MARALPPQSRTVEGVAEHGGVADAVEGPGDPAGQPRAPGRPRSAGGTSSRMAATASVAEASTKWVAPNCRASSSLAATVSTATIRLAPAMRSPWITLRPTPPTPKTAAVSPACDLGPVQHRAHPGQHAAADQAGRGQGDVLGDLARPGPPGRSSDSENTEVAGEVRGRLALEGEGRRDVPERSWHQVGWPVLQARQVAAAGQGGDDHVVARLHRRHLGAHGLDDAGPLVAEHGRCLQRDGAVDHRQVGVAHPGAPDAHLHLVGPGSPHLELVGDLDASSPV